MRHGAASHRVAVTSYRLQTAKTERQAQKYQTGTSGTEITNRQAHSLSVAVTCDALICLCHAASTALDLSPACCRQSLFSCPFSHNGVSFDIPSPARCPPSPCPLWLSEIGIILLIKEERVVAGVKLKVCYPAANARAKQATAHSGRLSIKIGWGVFFFFLVWTSGRLELDHRERAVHMTRCHQCIGFVPSHIEDAALALIGLH